MLYHESHPEGAFANPFNAPDPEDIDADVPGYGAAANSDMDRLSAPPEASGATPHERFCHPCSWWERFDMEASGIGAGVMELSEGRARIAQQCAASMLQPRVRKQQRKRRRVAEPKKSGLSGSREAAQEPDDEGLAHKKPAGQER